MISQQKSEKPCSTCGGKKKGKLQIIVEGWGNYLFPNPEVEKIAKFRALRCATCDFNKMGICSKCGGCPIIVATRSMDHDCPIGRW